MLIHYYYPPIHSTAVHRNYNLSLEWKKNSENLNVLTSKNASLLKGDSSYAEKMPCIQIPTLDYRTLRAVFRKGAMHVGENKKSKIFRWLSRLKDTFPFNIILDEGGFVYILRGYFEAKRLIKEEGFTCVYSSYRPWADHYIAYLLKRKFSKLLWIADFRDLPVEPLYRNVFWPKMQHQINRSFLKYADRLTTISEGLATHLRKYHTDVVVSYNGIKYRPITSSYEVFTMSYTGSLFGNERDPSVLLRALKELDKKGIISSSNFQFLYAGKDGLQMENYFSQWDLSRYFNNMGLVSHQQSLEIQSRSDVNVLLTSATPDYQGVFTTKLSEYVGSRRPALVIVRGVRDEEMERYLYTLKAGKVFYGDGNIAVIENYIHDLISSRSDDRKEESIEDFRLTWADTYRLITGDL